ncbi:MAG TPA: HU family DNA-binding protein [Vampirovibrionales bacterium]
MNKSELVDSIADKAGLSKKDSEKALNGFIDSVLDTIGSGDEVNITNFGAFKVKVRNARKGKNPQTGEVIDIPEKKVVKFSVGKNLKERAEASK